MSYDVIDYANSSAYPLVFKNMALIYKGKLIIDGTLDIECNY